jgi:hypothetical protein
MKTSISIFLFVLLSCTISFGQRNFFVNDTLQTEKNNKSIREIYAYNSISQIFDSHQAYVSIIGLTVVDNMLVVDITYRGGCGDYYFKLYEKYEIVDGVPNVSLLPLVVQDDKCELIQLETINFDFTKIRAKYKKPFILKLGRFENIINQ